MYQDRGTSSRRGLGIESNSHALIEMEFSMRDNTDSEARIQI